MMPVSGSASLKACAVRTASWPIIESMTNSDSWGWRTPCSDLISFIIASSIVSRPAVSTISTSFSWRFACSSAARAICSGLCPGSLG